MKKLDTDFKVRHRWLCRCMATLMVMIAAATVSMAQGSVRVDIEQKNATLPEVFEQLRRQTSLSVFFSNDDVGRIERKDYTIRNATVDQAMRQVLSGTDLVYELENNVILIRRVQAPVHQQSVITVTGRVTDENGTPLIGATVFAEDTRQGVLTDASGNFQLTVTGNANPRLDISFMGYVSRQVVWLGEPLIVSLEQDNIEMAEVLVTGVFERRYDTYSGAVTSFDRTDIDRAGNQNIIETLKVLDPSFTVIENNAWGSDPNRMPDIQMRGPSNFAEMADRYRNSPNQPLFIVDRFETSLERVLDMDMNRVASVTLLKDATAKALYGSRGANGVVVIETEVPTGGALKVSYTGDFTVSAPDLSSYRLANAAEKLEIEHRAGVYESANPLEQQDLYEKYAELQNEVLRGVDTYWLSVPLRTELGHKHALLFEGGDDAFRYGIDVSYNRRNGVMKGSNRETTSGTMNFQYNYGKFIFTDRLTVSFNTASDSPYGVFSEYARLNPYWRRYNDDGSIRRTFGEYQLANSQGSHIIHNPMMNAFINTKLRSSYTDITNNFYAEYAPLDELKFTAQLGVSSQSSVDDRFYPRDHTMFAGILPTDEAYFDRGRYTYTTGKSLNYDLSFTANYARTFAEKHLLLANARWAINQRENDLVTMMAQGFANNMMDYVTNAKEYYGTGPDGLAELSREASLTGSLNYSYHSRYNLDFTYTLTGSSLLGTERRWGGVWSTGMSWNMHNEAFMVDADWIQKLKLRASVGYSGSQDFATHQAIATYMYYNQAYNDIIGAYQLALANPFLRPQKTQDINVGIEMSVFRALDLTFDYYVNTTNSMIVAVDLPPSVGFPSYTENLGKTRNHGFEAGVNYRVLADPGREVYLSVFGKVAHNKNKLLDLSDALNSYNDEKNAGKGQQSANLETDHENNIGVTRPSVLYYEKASMTSIWAVRSLGIDPGNGQEMFLKRDGTMTYEWDAADQVVVGDTSPDMMGTFGFNLDWKGFTVNTIFAFNFGGQRYNQTLVEKVENADIQYNVDRRMYSDRWYEVGKPAQLKSFSTTEPFTRPTSRFVQNHDELSLASLSVGYDFRNAPWLKSSSSLERLRIQLYANDLFRLSTVKAERGTEYPFARTVSIKLSATF